MSTEYIWALCSHRAGDGSQVNQKTPERPATLDYLAEVTATAEEAGFANILVPCGTHCIDAWTTAGAISSRTKKIKFLVAFRPGITGPVYAAQQANSLDYLTRGRCTLNVVTGSTPVDQKRYGDFMPHDDRYARTGEFLDVVRKLWNAEGPLDYKGKFFEIENAGIFPERVTKPNPPIFLAGSSEPGKRVAWEHGDVHVMYAAEPEVVGKDIEEGRRESQAYERERPLSYGIRHLVCVRETRKGSGARRRGAHRQERHLEHGHVGRHEKQHRIHRPDAHQRDGFAREPLAHRHDLDGREPGCAAARGRCSSARRTWSRA